MSRQVASGLQVELCLLSLPPGFPAVPHHFNLSPVSSCPSQNRACAINAHGSPDNHSGFDRTSRCGAVLWPPLLCAAGVSLLCSTICRLLPSSGITRLRWYYETIRLPATVLPSSLCAVVGHTLGLSPLTALSCSSESSGRVSRVAVQSRCHACHGLRPRGSRHTLTFTVMPVLTSAHSDAVVLPVDLITWLNPFNLSAYGLRARWPTLRVQHYCCDSQGLATRWLAKPSKMGFSPIRLHGIAQSLQNPRPDPQSPSFFNNG